MPSLWGDDQDKGKRPITPPTAPRGRFFHVSSWLPRLFLCHFPQNAFKAVLRAFSSRRYKHPTTYIKTPCTPSRIALVLLSVTYPQRQPKRSRMVQNDIRRLTTQKKIPQSGWDRGIFLALRHTYTHTESRKSIKFLKVDSRKT